jgi:hypothetical protein
MEAVMDYISQYSDAEIMDFAAKVGASRAQAVDILRRQPKPKPPPAPPRLSPEEEEERATASRIGWTLDYYRKVKRDQALAELQKAGEVLALDGWGALAVFLKCEVGMGDARIKQVLDLAAFIADGKKKPAGGGAGGG